MCEQKADCACESRILLIIYEHCRMKGQKHYWKVYLNLLPFFLISMTTVYEFFGAVIVSALIQSLSRTE